MNPIEEPKESKWEKEFKKIPASIISPDGDGCECSSISGLKEYKQIKLFIQNLLNSQKEEIRKKIEGMRKNSEYIIDHTILPVSKDDERRLKWEVQAYNLALEDILKLL